MIEALSPQQLWEAALGELQIQVNKANYNTWLKKTAGLSLQDSELVVGVPNTFVAEYLDRNQRSLIEKVVAGIVNGPVRVSFRVDEGQRLSSAAVSRRKALTPPQQTSLPLFNPKYTFDSFIAGSSNQFAYAAALKVAENPGQNYNPLFIYGGPGLGKTHLLQAIGRKVLDEHSDMRVVYVSAERYTNEFMAAIREGKMEDFRSKYRSADMLLVDDVQFFSGKEQTGENFFHTFDDLHNASHQIAVTCDRPPQSLPLLPERLCSRFEWGLVTDVQPPDFETRLAILKAKAGLSGQDISPDILELIAHQIQQNIRSLEGSLNRVIAYARLIRATLTPELAAEALKDVAARGAKPLQLTPGLIIENVATGFQMTPSDLVGAKRDKETTFARRVAMFLIRQETNCSLAQIGKELGGRDAAAVTNACKRITGDIEASPYLRRKIAEIRQIIHPNKD